MPVHKNMKLKVEIKRLKENNLDEFFDLFSRLVKTQFKEYSEKSREYMVTSNRAYSKEKYLDLIKDPFTLLLGAYANNKLVGLLHANIMDGGVSLCIWIMVDPDFQKKGIGQKLLKHWENISLTYGAHSLFLYASKHNISFYEKMRFELSGLHKKAWYGTDDYIFTKLIQEPKEENYLR